MNVAALIGVMIAIVVGVTLIPTMLEPFKNVAKDSMPLPTTEIFGMFPIIFVALITIVIIGVVFGLTRDKGTNKEKEEESKGFRFSSDGLEYKYQKPEYKKLDQELQKKDQKPAVQMPTETKDTKSPWKQI